MTGQPITPLYAIAKTGAAQKWDEAGSLIDLALDGAKISHLEIAEVQKCATILDAFARQIYNDPAMWPGAEVTLETMQVRSNVISAALKNDDLSADERESLWQELAEIAAWIEREYTYISDYADAQLCARFGTQL